MFKKTIKYTDYMGNDREEDFYFDLSPAELTELELSTEGGLSAMIQKIIKAKDMPSLIATFKKLVLMSYGEISNDGRRFIKNDEVRTGFSQTPAYSILFMELATNDNAATEFVNGIIPKEEIDKIKQKQLENK